MCKVCKMLICFFIVQSLSFVFAIDFRFQYTTGHSYRILSTVEQEVFVNGIKSHDATIVNRISVLEKEAFSDGSGQIEVRFMTSENSARVGELPRYVWGEEYFSTFIRSDLGLYDIDKNAFMPVVRNVPLFTGKDVQAGYTWTAEGEEVHDMRLSFNIQKPFKVPFTAYYTYKGTEEIVGKTLHVILVNYDLYFKTPVAVDNTQNIPIATMGSSSQTLYWDAERGSLDHYTETFRIILETSFGDKIEFRGRAQADVINFEPVADDALTLVQDQLDTLDIEDVFANVTEKGITISLEDIQFEPNSAILLESELIKLRKIAEILSAFPQNDLLISGHTAFAGNREGRQTLSEDRANAVATYFSKLGLKRYEEIFTQGFGADIPLAPNDSPENMARNRRVEITILDK